MLKHRECWLWFKGRTVSIAHRSAKEFGKPKIECFSNPTQASCSGSSIGLPRSTQRAANSGTFCFFLFFLLLSPKSTPRISYLTFNASCTQVRFTIEQWSRPAFFPSAWALRPESVTTGDSMRFPKHNFLRLGWLKANEPRRTVTHKKDEKKEKDRLLFSKAIAPPKIWFRHLDRG